MEKGGLPQQSPRDYQMTGMKLAFSSVAKSLLAGIYRIFSARIVSNTATIVIIHANIKNIDPSKLPPEVQKIIAELKSISYREFTSSQEVIGASLLVYSTALFDSFLSDTTKFLLLSYPGSLGKDYQIPLTSLLSAKSKAPIINEAVSKRVRETKLSSFSWEDRVS
jgi:hypothetical protein